MCSEKHFYSVNLNVSTSQWLDLNLHLHQDMLSTSIYNLASSGQTIAIYYHTHWQLNRRGLSHWKLPFTHGANIFIIVVNLTQFNHRTRMWINPQTSYTSSYSQPHSWSIITPITTVPKSFWATVHKGRYSILKYKYKL